MMRFSCRNVAVAALLVCTSSVYADTAVSGTIASDTTWTAADSPYVVTGELFVDGTANPVLTIEAGVTVKLNANAEIVVNWRAPGSVQALGTAAAPIVVTANGSTTAGFWRAVYLGTNGSTNSSFAYTTVENGGWPATARGGIHVAGGAPSFDHVTFRNNLIAGLTIGSGTPTITDCNFVSNTGFGIQVGAGSPTINGGTFTDNTDYAITSNVTLQLVGMSGLSGTGNGTGGTKNAVFLGGGTISTSRRWYASALPYIVTGNVNVGGSGSPILTIDPGAVVKFRSGADMTVNWTDSGSLQAIGTAAAPILFTAESSTTAGSWIALYLGGAGAVDSRLEYVTVEYSGSGGRAGLRNGARGHVYDHVTCRSNATAGMSVEGGSPVITNGLFSDNAGYGLDVTGGSLNVSGSAFTGNTSYAMALSAGAQIVGLTGITASGNGSAKDAVLIRPGTISSSTTWRSAGLPYVLESGTLQIGGISAPVLTIEAGVTLRMGAGTDVTVAYVGPGAVRAIGTAAAPITFTGNGGTSAGSWLAWYLGGAGGPVVSRFEHATVEYGGSSSPVRGAIHVGGGAPEFDHVIFRNNLTAGLFVDGGSATVTSSAFTTNSGTGLEAPTGTLTVSSTTFTSNTAYALRMAPALDLRGGSGLVASGQPTGRNSIWVNGGNITSDRTWPATAIPYVLGGPVNVLGTPAPVFTLSPGTTLKLEPSAEIVVNYYGPGVLHAVGTAAAPILITSNASTPAPGSWLAVYLGAAAATTSDLAYTVIEYGGYAPWNRGAMHVAGGTARFDHVTFRNNAVAGLSLSGGSTVAHDCQFSGNAAGVTKSGTPSADLRRSYWGNSSGPSGSGYGSGESIPTNVLFEPWLISPPTTPHYISEHELQDQTFSPYVGSTARLLFATAAVSDWTLTVYDGAGSVVRTMSGTGASADTGWDGRNESGIVQAEGAYRYQIASVAGPNTAAPLAGRLIVDSSKYLAIVSPLVAPLYFSPNGDGTQDTTALTATITFETATWIIEVKSSGGTVVRTVSGSGKTVNFAWDGKDGGGVNATDGVYTLNLVANVGDVSATVTLSTTLDRTAPVATIANPNNGTTFSNVHRSGENDVVVSGTAADTNLLTWQLKYDDGTLNNFGPIANGTASISSSTLGTWHTRAIANTDYTLRLIVRDKAGNESTATVGATTENFYVSQLIWEFTASGLQTITYSSAVPFTLHETLRIKNEAGQVVRTLFNGDRDRGGYSDVWDGKNDQGVLVPDGAYFVSAAVAGGGDAITWDESERLFGGNFWVAAYPPGTQNFDPFNNKVQTVGYELEHGPYRVNRVVSTTPVFHEDCSGVVCLAEGLYEASGSHRFIWSGTAPNGAFLPDHRYLNVIYSRSKVPVNTVVVWGTRPDLLRPILSPPLYNPDAGLQTVSFDLQISGGRTADLDVKMINQGSLSTLRTLHLNDRSNGTITLTLGRPGRQWNARRTRTLHDCRDSHRRSW